MPRSSGTGRAKTINGRRRHLYGWRPDSPDHRDLMYSMSFFGRYWLPRRKDLRETGFLSKVENQGRFGSCTANASTSAIEFLFRQAGKEQPELSRMFLYYATRVWIARNPPSEDGGAMIRDVMKALMLFGVCHESTWPYRFSNFTKTPSQEAKKEALEHQILHYFRCPNLRHIRSSIAKGYPVIGGFAVPESMYGEETESTGVVKYPPLSEGFTGGHAVLFIGYDDKTKLLTFKNSWGRGWGDNGFGYLPYSFVENWLANDFWTIRTAEL